MYRPLFCFYSSLSYNLIPIILLGGNNPHPFPTIPLPPSLFLLFSSLVFGAWTSPTNKCAHCHCLTVTENRFQRKVPNKLGPLISSLNNPPRHPPPTPILPENAFVFQLRRAKLKKEEEEEEKKRKKERKKIARQTVWSDRFN